MPVATTPAVPSQFAQAKRRTLSDDKQSTAGPTTSEAPAGNWWRDDPIIEDSPSTPDASPKALSAEDLYDLVAPSVVTINVKDEDDEHIATGSGFIVGSDLLHAHHETLERDKWMESLRTRQSATRLWNAVSGHTSGPAVNTLITTRYILTNYHVIRPTVEVEIILHGGDKGVAWEVVAEDEQTDLALLSVTIPWTHSAAGVPLATVDPRVGATVYAIGSPAGLSSSLSEGIVSGFRELNEGSRWLQTTAPISHGSSGGPLVLADGTVVGVTTLTRSDAQNLNFAIPVSNVRAFLSRKSRAREFGEGASVSWHEIDAFSEMSVAVVTKKGYSQAESKAAERLSNVWRERSQGRFDQALRVAQESEQSLPNKYKYLAAYLAGRSSASLAYEASYEDETIKTIDEIRARYRANDHAKAALHHLVRVTKLKPDFSPAFKWLAVHNSYAGNWPDALLASDSLVKLMPRCAEAFQRRGRCYDELGRYESARDDLRTAIELAPRSGELRSDLARVFLSLGDYAEVIACYETALELKYSPQIVHYGLGRTYQNMGQFERAISEFEQARAAGMPADWCDQEIAKCRRGQR